MANVVTRLVDKDIQFLIRNALGPPRKLVQIVKVLTVGMSALLARRRFAQHVGGLDIQALVLRQAAPNEALNGKPLL
jgi:hypothetical protein